MTLPRQPAGLLTAADAGRRVLLRGWVGRRRDLGELIFLNVRDRSGLVQVLFERARSGEEAVAKAGEARAEDVVEVEGEVALRGAAQVNRELPTGEVEVVAKRLEFLARAETPPFLPEDRTNATEELRLQYRYVDLRRPSMLANFVLRDEIAFRIRRTLHERGFLEVETPMLTKSTPEGARDYLVPSRVHRGKFYALPQSPQLFKQILMVSGFERYFQIARCFRDEDLRADRQPEFTQIDIEMSFATEDDVFGVVEAFLAAAFGAAGIDVATPFPRVPYADAMERYGTDRPDLRYGMALVDLSGVVGSEFAPFQKAIAGGGSVRGLRVPGGASVSRKTLDAWTELARSQGSSGLVWGKRVASETSSPAKKALGDAALDRLFSAAAVGDGDLLLAVADARRSVVSASLAALRGAAALETKAFDSSTHAFCWVTEFPLFGRDENTGAWFPMNHPFTSPREEDLPLLESDPGRARARAYDVVMDGVELGSGSIRIHRADVQERVFRALGISEREGRERFGFLLDALRFGAPPHGGMALGLDRICMIAAGASSLREVIAFPKTTSGSDLMTGSPSSVEPAQLDELGIAPVPPPEP